MFAVHLAECDSKEHHTSSVSPGYSQAIFQGRSWERGCRTWPGTSVVGSSDPRRLEVTFLSLLLLAGESQGGTAAVLLRVSLRTLLTTLV